MPVITNRKRIKRPLNHARIGYHNLVLNSSVVADDELPDFPASVLENPSTAERWRSNATSPSVNIFFNTGANVVNYVAIAAYKLENVFVEIRTDSNIINSTFVTKEMNEPILFLFDDVSTTKIGVVFIGPRSGSGTKEVGVIYTGRILEMERAFFSGHSPMVLSRNTTKTNNISEGGQYLGTSVIRRGQRGSFSWSNLSDRFYRNEFDPFVDFATNSPFFIAWNIKKHSSDIAFCFTEDDIIPRYNGTKNLIDVSFNAIGVIA